VRIVASGLELSVISLRYECDVLGVCFQVRQIALILCFQGSMQNETFKHYPPITIEFKVSSLAYALAVCCYIFTCQQRCILFPSLILFVISGNHETLLFILEFSQRANCQLSPFPFSLFFPFLKKGAGQFLFALTPFPSDLYFYISSCRIVNHNPYSLRGNFYIFLCHIFFLQNIFCSLKRHLLFNQKRQSVPR